MGNAGSKGDDGEDGKDGKNGKDGKDGNTGSIGLTGPVGQTGLQGPANGIQGIQGVKGEDGKKGADGYIAGLESFKTELYANSFNCVNGICTPSVDKMKSLILTNSEIKENLIVKNRNVLEELDALKSRLDNGDLNVAKSNSGKYMRVYSDQADLGRFKAAFYDTPNGQNFKIGAVFYNT